MIPITPQAEVGVVASAPKNRGIFPFKPPVLYPYTHTKFFGDFENRRCLTSATLRAVNAPIGDGRLGWGCWITQHRFGEVAPVIGRPFLSDSIPMLTDSFCPIVYQRQRVTRDAQNLKSCECYAREVVDAPNPYLVGLQ